MNIEIVANLLLQHEGAEYSFIPQPEHSLPSIDKMEELMNSTKTLLFPGFFVEVANCKDATISNIKLLQLLLYEQIYNALYFLNENTDTQIATAEALTAAFVDKLPLIKHLLATDVKACSIATLPLTITAK
jgi:hypothetical protein